MTQPRRHLAGLLVALVAWAAPAVAVGQSPSDDRIWLKADRTDTPDAGPTSSSIAPLVDESSSAVVNVIVHYAGGESDSSQKPLPGPFGGTGQGSGFIIHPDGYVLTNHHVVKRARQIKIRLEDGTEYSAEVVGVEPHTDIALMRIDADRKFPALPLGDSDELRVGDFVIAIGNPLGLNHSVSSGIVAALGRRNLGVGQKELYTDFIQLDVNINPGNSGGPLLTLGGEVVGINTAINRRGQGIGFAIPINMVKRLLPQLRRQGYVTRSWLGARVQELTPALAESFGLDEPEGALVTEVVSDSPAEKGGVKAGDVIRSFDGETVRSSDELPWMVAITGPDNRVEIEIVRKGEKRSLDVKLAEHPEQTTPDVPSTAADTGESSPPALAVDVENLTDSLARQLGAQSTSGVVVTEIGDDSPAKGAGLRRRDVIVEVDRREIESKRDFQSIIDELDPDDVVRLKVVRGGRTVYIAFER